MSWDGNMPPVRVRDPEDKKHIADLEAQCAAIREALENVVEQASHQGITGRDLWHVARAGLGSDAGETVLNELACLRAALGFQPLSLREAIRTGDDEACRAWEMKGQAFKAELVEKNAELQQRAEKAERERERDAVVDSENHAKFIETARERDAALAQVKVLREALEACHSFLNDPEGFAGVTISDTVWTGPGETLKDWVEGALAATEVKP